MAGSKKKSDATSKKAITKAKMKVIEDKTFGLKNKNKSKKVQQHVKAVEKTVMGERGKKEMDAKEQRRLKKLAEKQREAELKALFNVVPSKEEIAKKEEEKLAKEQEAAEDSSSAKKDDEVKEEEALTLLAQIEDEMREEEEMSLEEVIEKERTKLADGIPVTYESFKKWKDFKMEQQAKEEERLRQLEEQAFRKTGHGISGRNLFQLDKSVFVDDAEAADVIEREEGEIELDADLFLADDTSGDNLTTTTTATDEEPKSDDANDYNEDTWQDKSKPPKAILQDYISKNKIKTLPKYEATDCGGMGFYVKVTLPHLNDMTFEPKKVYKTKKAAENNAALYALRYLEKQPQQDAPAQ